LPIFETPFLDAIRLKKFLSIVSLNWKTETCDG